MLFVWGYHVLPSPHIRYALLKEIIDRLEVTIKYWRIFPHVTRDWFTNSIKELSANKIFEYHCVHWLFYPSIHPLPLIRENELLIFLTSTVCLAFKLIGQNHSRQYTENICPCSMGNIMRKLTCKPTSVLVCAPMSNILRVQPWINKCSKTED